ncbi:hypothetical protein M427DRAFT_47239 [Gonapodya prolifera JEL478]|uniref:Integral membrane protein n=1 Tax=Gonapodya prolifera (strain JEL478) TaxID=1344416 RepID=A0A139A4S0_GONPJ|nr:hypothetical protein M427DRAFT_47239 [Gonapodya prolifera JEL478]|eukprot:KXS11383.1 hypothetical protein M427DRAFT_47239 [Gonapodya prolifera JEL478]
MSAPSFDDPGRIINPEDDQSMAEFIPQGRMIHVQKIHPSLGRFHPTRAVIVTHADGKHTFTYNSRMVRKGRMKSRAFQAHYGPVREGAPFTTLKGRLRRLEAEFKPHLEADISFWVAFIFTLGSVVWVMNVCLPLYLSYISTSEDLTTLYYKVSASLAFVGGSLFEVGSYLMVVEALNRGRENEIGEALERLFDDETETPEIHQFTGNGSPGLHERERRNENSGLKDFVWWGAPMWRDIGWMASIIQFGAATVFYIATMKQRTGLPGVIPGFPGASPTATTVIFFWTPQVVGGTGFIISSLLLMLEVQKHWYIPNVSDLGWHVGFWNLVGGIGFTVCGAMGYSTEQYWIEQSGWATFWGSWAFLVGSVLQVYETIWREPNNVDSEAKETL